MPPRTHIVQGETHKIYDVFDNLAHGRTAEDVARDITEVHKEIAAGMGTLVASYTLRPETQDGDTLYVVVDYPESEA